MGGKSLTSGVHTKGRNRIQFDFEFDGVRYRPTIERIPSEGNLRRAATIAAVAPAVLQSPRFAMKGGTALNLFLQDMPRLSADIDVVFTDRTLDREAVLQAIGEDLNAVKPAISALRPSRCVANHKER